MAENVDACGKSQMEIQLLASLIEKLYMQCHSFVVECISNQ